MAFEPPSSPADQAETIEPPNASPEQCFEWLDQWGDDLFSYARARVDRREIAEDLVQETFLAAIRSHAEYDGKASIRTWLISILRHKIIDHYRSATRDRKAGEQMRTMAEVFSKGTWSKPFSKWKLTFHSQIERDEFWRVYSQCVAELPELSQEVFRLRVVDAVRMDDVSQMMGVRREQLSARLYRARLAMRDCLEKHWFGG